MAASPVLLYMRSMKSSNSVNSQERSNRSLALVVSSAVSNRLKVALHAFRSIGFSPNSCSLTTSLCRFCHIEMATRGAHSFLTNPLSKDWKAPMTKDIRCVRILVVREGSMIMDMIRRKNDENSDGLVVK